MEIVLSAIASEHIDYWKETNNVAIQKRIKSLKNAIIASPHIGLGKPEPAQV